MKVLIWIGAVGFILATAEDGLAQKKSKKPHGQATPALFSVRSAVGDDIATADNLGPYLGVQSRFDNHSEVNTGDRELGFNFSRAFATNYSGNDVDAPIIPADLDSENIGAYDAVTISVNVTKGLPGTSSSTVVRFVFRASDADYALHFFDWGASDPRSPIATFHDLDNDGDAETVVVTAGPGAEAWIKRNSKLNGAGRWSYQGAVLMQFGLTLTLGE